MKIICWNCNMAFRKKAHFILPSKPDIAIISECEHPDKLKFKTGIQTPDDILWCGKNQNKGLGIFAYTGLKFAIHDSYKDEFRNILPILVTGGKVDFTLFAIWANNPADKSHQYIGQVWKALHYYEKLIGTGPVILAGDFNSNTIWDKPKREGNHSTVVDLLEKKNIFSTYHTFYKQQQGKEKHNTLFMYRHPDKAYHIDYCFASKTLADKVRKVEVGSHKTWCKLSDHMPLTVHFDL